MQQHTSSPTQIWPQASSHVGVACRTEQHPDKFTSLQHQMRMNMLSKFIVSINTPSEMMPAKTLCQSSTANATKRDNAHRRHKRSAQPSSCAEGTFLSSPICNRTRFATQPRRTPVVSFRCCSTLSAIRTANRCSSAFQFNVSPDPRSTSAFEACCSWHPLANQTTIAELPELASAWISKLDFSFRGLNHRVHLRIRHCGCPALTGNRDRVSASSGVSQSPKVHQDIASFFVVVFRRQIAHVAVRADLLQ